MLKRILSAFCIALLMPHLHAEESAIQFAYTFENHSIGQLIDEFSTQTSIKIERRFIPQAELKILLLESIEKGTAPDVVLVPSDHTGLYRPMRFSPLSEQMSTADISPENWQTARVDGQIYGAPIIRGNHLMLYYNRALVTQPAATWQALQNQASSLRAKGVEPIAWNYNEMYFFVPFLGAFGGWPVTDGKLSLNTEAMVEGLKAYRSLSDSELVDPDCDYDCAFDNFKSGKLAYTINGDWALKDFQDALGDQLGIALLPAWQDKPLVPMFSTHVVVFPGDSLQEPRKKDMLKLVNFLQSYPIQKKLWQDIKVFPVEERAYAEAVDTIAPELKALLLQLNNARAMPSERAMSYAWGAMIKGYTRFMNDVITASEAAELMQKLAQRELAKD